MAGQAWLDIAELGKARQGKAGDASPDAIWLAETRQSQVQQDMAGKTERSVMRLDRVRHGMTKAWQARRV